MVRFHGVVLALGGYLKLDVIHWGGDLGVGIIRCRGSQLHEDDSRPSSPCLVNRDRAGKRAKIELKALFVRDDIY